MLHVDVFFIFKLNLNVVAIELLAKSSLFESRSAKIND